MLRASSGQFPIWGGYQDNCTVAVLTAIANADVCILDLLGWETHKAADNAWHVYLLNESKQGAP